MKYKIGKYLLSNGEERLAVKITEGTGYILYLDYAFHYPQINAVQADGTDWPDNPGLIDISRETGSCWLEGADEYCGVFATYEEAYHADL